MSLTFFWRAESGTFSGTDDFSAGDSTPTQGTSAPTYSAAQARAGTNSLLVNASDEHFAFDKASIVSVAEGVVGFSLYVTTWEAGADIFKFVNSAVPNDTIGLGLFGTDELRFRIGEDGQGNSDLETTAANLTTGNWYGIVLRWHEANQDQRIEVYDVNGALIQAIEDLAVTAALFPPEADMDEIRFGDSGGITSAAYHLDNLIVADTYTDKVEKLLHLSSYADVNLAAENINFFWRAEGLTLDATDDFSLADTTVDVGATNAAIQSSIALVGTNALSTIDNAGSAILQTGIPALVGSVGSAAQAFRVENWNVSEQPIIFSAIDLSDSGMGLVTGISGADGSGQVAVVVKNSGSGSTSTVTTTASLSSDTWYIAVCRWDEGNQSVAIEVYSSTGTLLDSVEDVAVTAGNFPDWSLLDQITILTGAGGGGTNIAQSDTFIISDTYDEPLQDYFDITTFQDYGAAGVTGTGTPAAQAATAVGSGAIGREGTGTPAAQAATVAAAGFRGLDGGAVVLTAQAASASGAGLRVSTVSLVMTAANNREFRDAAGALVASLSAIAWEWYDTDDSTAGEPIDSGTFNTDASGEATISITGSSLGDGQFGQLLIYHPSDPLIRATLRVPVTD